MKQAVYTENELRTLLHDSLSNAAVFLYSRKYYQALRYISFCEVYLEMLESIGIYLDDLSDIELGIIEAFDNLDFAVTLVN